MDLIFLGDIIGIKALEAAVHFVQSNPQATSAIFKIANAENTSGGFGLTEDHYNRLMRGGFDLISGGNHIWDKKEIFHYISRSKIARPYNLPKGAPGSGVQVVEKNGAKVGLVNVLGRVFMSITALECPFRSCDRAIDELKTQGVTSIIVDVHAEATSEKAALAHYLDGRVAAVVGTHTHVQTADERILPKGTAFITDVGPCVPTESVIGMSIETMLPRFLTGLPSRAEVSNEPVKVHGVKITLNEQGCATAIVRVKS
jgi:2',3'-cyclic-nucleotide 2'-phosphodiesterase